MKKLKTVISGLGRIGWQFHIKGVAGNDGFDLAAVCDPLAERRDEANEKYSVKGYNNFREMIDAERPELTVIASPTHLHAEQAVYALERGSDVFLDKPMARDLAEADTIIAAKENSGRKLMMYQPHRYTAITQKIKEIIESGIIGDVYMIKTSACNYVFRNDWQSFKKYGGGMLNNSGAHSIDMTLYLSGSAAARVTGHMRRVASAGDADDVVKILIETVGGVTIDIDINMAAAVPLPHTIIYGSCGAISEFYKNDERRLLVRYFDPSERGKTTASDKLAAEGRRYVTAAPENWKETEYIVENEDGLGYYDKCYDYFALGDPPFVDVMESREVMRVIAECRKSAGWSQDL